MPENRIIPVGHVERALGAQLEIYRDARLVMRLEDLADPAVIVGRSVLGPVMKQDPLEVLVLV